MERVFLVTALLQCLITCRAEVVTLPFENYCEPFYSTRLKIFWAATNQLPATARVFKVVPAEFSPTAVSNLTVMGGSASSKRGLMLLYKPADARLPNVKVPDRSRAYELGTNLLARLAIPANELATKEGKIEASFYPGTRGFFDKATRKPVTEACEMGISFQRALDGIRCFGQEVRIRFGSQEAITDLRVNWHGLQTASTSAVASPEQIVSWIKEGRARALSVETTGSRWISVAGIKKLTIRKIELFYDAEPDRENRSVPREYLYPCASLDAEIEFSTKDRETLALCCPIINEALSKPLRENSEFNIVPATSRR